VWLLEDLYKVETWEKKAGDDDKKIYCDGCAVELIGAIDEIVKEIVIDYCTCLDELRTSRKLWCAAGWSQLFPE
jgi:hypothetical protein